MPGIPGMELLEAGTPFPRCVAHAAACESRPSVKRVLAHEEAELRRLGQAGRLPPDLPAFQAGRAPAFTAAG